MAGVWIEDRRTASGARRWKVVFRAGGREAKKRNGGTFHRKRDADARLWFIHRELAEGRVPDFSRRGCQRPGRTLTSAPTVREAAHRWHASRVDVAPGTEATYRVAFARIFPRLGDRPIDSLAVTDITDLIAELGSLKRESIRKTLNVLAQVLDFAGVANPVRDKRVKLPREQRRHVSPPTADHLEAVHRILPSAYKLPLVVLDATGMRISELASLTWGDVDEPRKRWRVSAGVAKSGAARWVTPPPIVFDAVVALCPRDDRTPERPVFQGFGPDAFRTQLVRSCTAAGVPVFSPHDLRHRRVSLLHLAGVPWVRIGEEVGHADIVTTARTYTHVVADEREFDYVALL